MHNNSFLIFSSLLKESLTLRNLLTQSLPFHSHNCRIRGRHVATVPFFSFGEVGMDVGELHHAGTDTQD